MCDTGQYLQRHPIIAFRKACRLLIASRLL